MLAFEHFRQGSFPQHSFSNTSSSQDDSYQSLVMDSYPVYNNIPFTFYEPQSLLAEAPHDIKYEMARTASQSSYQPRHHDIPPTLLSSGSGPSIPSASSSTVGSPYSGHIHTVPHHDMYTTSTANFLAGPAIVCDETFPSDFSTAHFEPDATFTPDSKLAGSFVGECADLSSFTSRSSTLHSNGFQPPVSLSSPSPISPVSEPVQKRDPHNPRSRDLQCPTPSPAPSLEDHARPAASQGVFKSPTTPASAYPKTPSSNSATVTRGHSLSHSATAVSSTQPMQQHGNNSRYHFFSQSSGSFMPPIESSCPSFLTCFSLPLSFFSYVSSISSTSRHAGKPELTHDVTDPVLISGHHDAYLNAATYGAYSQSQVPHAPSPAPSSHSYHSFSQPVTLDNFGMQQHGRRPSISSQRSGNSPHTSFSGDEDSKEKGRCPYPDCGRVFKDLKAHMLTHESERPEKCPILSCEYNKKGFARKYDKNRHTLTHYKGTMVCGFCPGSGSAAEKSFNRADVFKRHLTSMHQVEQTPPNSRKRSPSKSNVKLSSYCQDATGKCSTCSATFENAQEFYEHLDDCVLKVVQQEEPSEAINAQRLREVSHDADVQDTFERNYIKSEDSLPSMDDDEDDEDEYDDDDEDEEMIYNDRSGRGGIRAHKSSTSRPIIGGNISKKPIKKGMTWSKGGGAIVGKSRKRRKFYPPSWGMSTDKMNMKKRVLCVYDGQRRLLKDDMMMHNEFEVRMPLTDGSYVTDLDVETLNRAEAFHNATPEEKGPWIQESDFLSEFMN